MFNIVYADKYDTIFYISGGRMPKRKLHPSYNWQSTLPGNSSQTLWNEFHDLKELPQYINPKSGLLYNTNHSPFLASDSVDNLDPSQFDLSSNYELHHNNRSAGFLELIKQYDKLDYDQFRRIKYDNQLPKRLFYTYNIDSMFLLNPIDYPDISELITIFQGWDKRADTGSSGGAIFLLTYNYITNNRRKWTGTAIGRNDALEIYRHIKNYQRQYFGRSGITLGELQKHVRGEKEMPVWGIPDVITAMYNRPHRNGRLKVVAGESYIELIRFPKNGLPIIETVNTYGASTHYNSPHYSDQMEMFLQQKPRR